MSCIAAALRPRRFEISHYFRLSTASRNLERQRDALKAADCRRLFADKKSGKTADRPELAARHAFLTEGDTLVVPNLNRSAPGGPPVPSNPPPRRQHPDSPGIALWIAAGLLAAVAMSSGISKTFVPKDRLAAFHQRAFAYGWTADAGGGLLKTLGVVEVLAAVGLILPAALGVAPVLVPVTAVC